MATRKNDDINRAELLKIANLVRPALAAQPYIPALTHIYFSGQMATAYNDVAAISVACDFDIERCLPGDYLIRALGSFNGETIALQYAEGSVTIRSGRSQLKVPTLSPASFPYNPEGLPEPRAELDLTDEIIASLKLCLMSVGNDPTKPAALGVTLDTDAKGGAVIFSTDNHTISRAQTDVKIKLPGGAPLFLPTFFCEQVVKFAAAYDKDIVLELHNGGVVAHVGKAATIFSKILVDVETLDFPRVISRLVDLDDLHESLVEIPAGFDEALARHMLVLGSVTDKSTKLTVEDGALLLHSESPDGHADDRFKVPSHVKDSERFVDPGDLARAARFCTSMALIPNTVVMVDAKELFVHLISHVDPKQAK